MGNNNPESPKFALTVGIGSFFTAVFFSFFSEIVLPKVHILILSLLFLILIILIGILFDMIGVAAAVAEQRPFHAKAAKKIKGAGHSLMLLKNAHKVSSICNDVVGDICGTVSGALGVAIAMQIVMNRPVISDSYLTMGMTGLVAALTVGGKAAAKKTAMVKSAEIIFLVGRILARIEGTTGLKMLGGSRRINKERKK